MVLKILIFISHMIILIKKKKNELNNIIKAVDPKNNRVKRRGGRKRY